MSTTSIVNMIFDDSGCTIASVGSDSFSLRDNAGNQVTVSLKAVLRCLAVAEHEKLVPLLPSTFWTRVEQPK